MSRDNIAVFPNDKLNYHGSRNPGFFAAIRIHWLHSFNEHGKTILFPQNKSLLGYNRRNFIRRISIS